MIVDILLIAINRPKILEITLSSFTSKIKGIDFKNSTIYMHVDPVPCFKNYEKLEEIAKKYIGNVVVKYSMSASQPNAVYWMFQQCAKMTCDLFFLLPDDWEFIKEVNIDDVIKRFNINKGVKSVALNNDWEHGLTFGNSRGKHQPLERGKFRGTPAFFKVDLIKNNLNKLKPVWGELLNLGAVAFNKNTSYSLWLSDEWKYYCRDIGATWKNENKIPGSMMNKCGGKYKMCIYCGNLKWRYTCQDLSGNKCKNCHVLCSEKCWEDHCNMYHKEDKEKYKLHNNFPNDNDFNKYHNNFK
jgi:hypothetical protein